MGRRVVLAWVTLALALLLVIPHLAAAAGGAAAASTDDPEAAAAAAGDGGAAKRSEEEEDEWEDFEDDDEVSLAAASSRSVGRAVKALPMVTDQNADRILNSTDYVLLLGYASWCKQSAALMIDFADAATILAAKGSPVVLAKVDAVANPVTASRYKIKGYPTIVFVTNGEGEMYIAGQSRDDLINWVQKRTGRPATTFSTVEEAKELKKRDLTVVIGLFEKFEGPEYDEFLVASIDVLDVEFLQTTNAEAAKVFSADIGDVAPAVAIWKTEPEKFIKYGGQLERADIVPFVALNKLALVTKLYNKNAAKVYASPVKKQVILFANNYDYESIYPFYLAAAKYFKGQMLFLWVDIEDEDFSKPMTTMYGISGSEAVVAGFDNTNGSRYLMESEVTRQNLKGFLINFNEGRVKLHYKSEPIPKKNKGDVKVVVGKTFEKLVLKSQKDVLLLVSTSYCHDCEALGKAFVKLAKHFKGLSSIVFAKVDATANEHPELQVQNYPAVLLYRVSSKGSPPVEAPAKPTFKKLVQFLEENDISLLSNAKENSKSEPESTSPPIEVDTEKLQENSEEESSAAKPDSESELESIQKEGDLLQPTDGVSEQTVTSLEFPKTTDGENEGAAAEAPVDELHPSSKGDHVATAEVPVIHTKFTGQADGFLKSENIASDSTVVLRKEGKTETESEPMRSRDDEQQSDSEKSHNHDEL